MEEKMHKKNMYEDENNPASLPVFDYRQQHRKLCKEKVTYFEKVCIPAWLHP